MAADGLLIGLALLAGVALGPVALLVVIPVLLLVSVIRGQVRIASFVMAAICALAGVARAESVPEVMPIEMLEGSNAAIATVEGLPVAGGTYERVFVRVERLRSSDDVWSEADGRMIVYLPQRGPGVGMGVRLFLAWSPTPVERLDPGYGSFVASQGAAGSAFVWSYEVEVRGSAMFRTFSDVRRRITFDLQRAIPGDAGALAAGVVTGDDSGLSEEARRAFRQTGTGHITAVSGQNVGLLIGFLAIWMRPGRRLTRFLTHGTMLSLVWLYVVMVGLEPPAMRAATVATFMMLAVWFGRRPDPLTILSLTLGGMAVLDPRMVGSDGFWLSAAASWALCSSMTTQQGRDWSSAAIDTVRGVIAANIATLPILLWAFGEWSPISLLANLLIGPIITLTFPAAYLLAMMTFGLPLAAPWLAWIPAIGLDIVLVIVDRLASVMPLLHLPVSGPAMALTIALPCFCALVLLSRDGERWRGVLAKEWERRGSAAQLLTSGIVVGGGIVVIAGWILR